jgi:hypothetical protein
MATERIFKLDAQGGFVLLSARDPLRRYRYKTHPADGDNIYVEFTDAEEADRTAEEALPPPPFAGPGRCVATRTGQVIPGAAATPIGFDTELFDNAAFHDTATNSDRFIIPPRQAGTFAITAQVRFAESSAAGGGTANAGDRVMQIRVAGAAITSVRQRASSAGDTELAATTEVDLAAGDVVRLGVFQNCGGTLPVDARISIRRITG